MHASQGLFHFMFFHSLFKFLVHIFQACHVLYFLTHFTSYFMSDKKLIKHSKRLSKIFEMMVRAWVWRKRHFFILFCWKLVCNKINLINKGMIGWGTGLTALEFRYGCQFVFLLYFLIFFIKPNMNVIS